MEAESSQKPESGPVQEGPQSGLEFPVSPAGILEAVLFVGRPDNRPFSTGELVELMNGVRSAEIDGLVEELNLRYRRDGSPYEVVARASGYEMVLRDEVRDVQDRFFGRTREARLSTAAIEVLSVVAYNQPLPASQVNAIRGKPSASLLAQLVRRRLLTLDRPPEGEPGSPQYRTTDRFLQLLGLESLADLPPLNDDENGL